MNTVLAQGYILLNQITSPPAWVAQAEEPAPPAPNVPTDLSGISASAPPGSGGFITLLQWGLWIAFAFCIGGVVKAAGGLAWAGAGRGSGGDHGSGMGWAIFGTILCGSVGTIVTLVA